MLMNRFDLVDIRIPQNLDFLNKMASFIYLCEQIQHSKMFEIAIKKTFFEKVRPCQEIKYEYIFLGLKLSKNKFSLHVNKLGLTNNF